MHRSNDPASLPVEVKVTLGPSGGGKEPTVTPKQPSALVDLTTELAVVFGREALPAPGGFGVPVAFKWSFIGLDLDGIHTSTYNSEMRTRLVVSPGGESVSLVTLSETGPKNSDGQALAGGEPIGLLRVADGKPEPVGPPVIWASNGAGTRSAISSTRGRPCLR